MISSRVSGASQRNSKLREVRAKGANKAWVATRPKGMVGPGTVLLVGGASILDFRLRVAQSHLRHDLLPSFWSIAGVMSARDRVLTVPLDEQLAPTDVPSHNAIHECPLSAYDDPRRYPNIAVVNFARHGEVIAKNVRRLSHQRSAIDLPHLLVQWLGFVWGAAAAPNPLVQSVGIPGAALTETAFGMSGIELTPGIASGASCPEAVWQSAVWWHEYYARTSDIRIDGQRVDRRSAGGGEDPVSIVPWGECVIRQPAAAVVERAGSTRKESE